MKIVERPEYENRFICIWVGCFPTHGHLLARTERVLAPRFEGTNYDFDSVAELTTGSERSYEELFANPFGWQTFEVAAVLARARELDVGPIDGFVKVNHSRCEAGPHDFPGFTFLGAFPSRANPDVPWLDV